MTQHQKAVFIFRRDLRLEDNLGLIAALEASASVLPIFIFDPRQVDREQNEYFSEPAFAFLLASLRELDAELKKHGSQLYVFHGDPAAVVSSLITKDQIDAVHVNKDYTPFARKRDKAIADVCEAQAVHFSRHDDLLLSPIETIRTGQDKLYSVFTPFKKNAAGYEVASPVNNTHTHYYAGELATTTVTLDDYQAAIEDRTLMVSGGRAEAIEIMAEPTFLNHYSETRNLPTDSTGTSRLSAHHKFGTISIRETFALAKQAKVNTDDFISELYWRDFYYYTAYHFPIVFGTAFLPWEKYMTWENNSEQFAAWCAGQTGVPMVDAGMRELVATGWMHNRTRMVVASYLSKNLLVDWRWGERFFATQLVDYDPAANNGGWQWSASVGTDPKPIRIFNPYTQATKYDPDGSYIKRWVPELTDVPTKLLTDGKTQDFSALAPGYPAPIVDQKETYHRAREAYKTAKDAWKAEQV